METVKINERDLYAQIGMRIKEIRESQSEKLTQAKLGEFVGLERSSISNIEKGTQRVPLHILFGLCATLRVDPSTVIPSIDDVKVDTGVEEVRVGDKVLMMPSLVAQAIAGVRL